MCLKLLVAMGIHTIVAGLAMDKARLECARRIGAARVVNVESEDVLEVVRQATGGAGASIAIEAAGSAASLRNCLEAVRPMGRITQAGIFGKDIEIPLDRLFHKQLELRGFGRLHSPNLGSRYEHLRPRQGEVERPRIRRAAALQVGTGVSTRAKASAA